jgi:hypothetical protein
MLERMRIEMATATNPRTFQMPANSWTMVKRIIRAYGAAQEDEDSNVQSVADLAGMHRPIVSANNGFLRSLGVLDVDKCKLTPLGVKLATGIGLESAPIVAESLQEIAKTTPVLAQLANMLRARGPMDITAFRGQIILTIGLNERSPHLGMVKTLVELLEESQLIGIRDDRVFLGGTPPMTDNSFIQPDIINPPNPSDSPKPPTDPNMDRGSYGSNRADTNPWAEQLLSKFPQFDPTWPDEVKLKWFDGFDRLMKGRGM